MITRESSVAEAQQHYLDHSTDSMPMAGFLSWSALAIAAYMMGEAMPSWIPFTAAAAPFPIALVLDKLRGRPSIMASGTDDPMTQLFMRFIFVIALLIPFAAFAAFAVGSLDLLILGLALFAGMIWVPHGFAANDPAGMRHFILRAALCYGAYVFAPEEIRGALIAAAAALTYVYAVMAMKKPGFSA